MSQAVRVGGVLLVVAAVVAVVLWMQSFPPETKIARFGLSGLRGLAALETPGAPL